MDRYSARMNLYGTTQREREKNRLVNTLNNKLHTTLSYKPILLNGKSTHLIINSGTQPYYKEFQSLPSQEINIGDYIEWSNSHWIVTKCDSDDEIYRDGTLEQSNYLLKWQNELGEIIERWSVIKSASKYNDGTNSNNVITLGSDQLSIIVPVDSETIKLKKSMGKKFFIDGNIEDPTTYELTGTGNVTDTYNGHGITSWIAKECAYSPSSNDLKYGVCDYREYGSFDINAKETESVLFDLSVKITGNKNLKLGTKRNYTATIKDSDGNAIEWNNELYKWRVLSDFSIEHTINNNKLSLIVEDDELIGSSFTLEVVRIIDNVVIGTYTITIIDIL